MTSDRLFGWARRGPASGARALERGRRARRAACLGLLAAGIAAVPAGAAEPSYPFEGTWVRANRVCVANARVRTYTPHEVTFATGHCTFRKVAAGGGQFEIFEECRKADHPGNFTETIRMLGPDLMQLRRQAARLKIARPLRYARCTIAAPAPAAGTAKTPAPAPHHAGEPAPHEVEDRAVKPPEPKP